VNRHIKIIITLLLCLGVVLSVIFDELLWNIVLMGVLLAKNILFKVLLVLKQFFFKQGVVSLATVAWKKVFVSSFFALSKRAMINTVTGFFQNRVVTPLIHPLTRYIRVRWALFKASSLWKKTYTILFGSVPTTLALWVIGVIDALMLLLKSFSLAKFLTLILKFLSTFLVFFQNLWRSWIQPYIDFIIITVFVSYVEKIPVIGALFRRLRITLRWKWRHFKRRKDRLIDQHVDQNVNLVSERIHQHVNAKKKQVAAQLDQTAKTPEAPAEKAPIAPPKAAITPVSHESDNKQP